MTTCIKLGLTYARFQRLKQYSKLIAESETYKMVVVKNRKFLLKIDFPIIADPADVMDMVLFLIDYPVLKADDIGSRLRRLLNYDFVVFFSIVDYLLYSASWGGFIEMVLHESTIMSKGAVMYYNTFHHFSPDHYIVKFIKQKIIELARYEIPDKQLRRLSRRQFIQHMRTGIRRIQYEDRSSVHSCIYCKPIVFQRSGPYALSKFVISSCCGSLVHKAPPCFGKYLNRTTCPFCSIDLINGEP